MNNELTKQPILFKETERAVDDVRQTQNLRLYGDGFIALYLIYLGIKGKVSNIDKLALVGIAAVTFGYNFKQWRENR